MKPMIHKILLLPILILSLAGCDGFSREDGILVIAPPVGSDAEKVLQTLKGRFEDFRPSVFSSVDATLDSGRLHFVFHRGAPEAPILGTLVMQRGVLTATLETGEVLYTNDDIVDALAVMENSKVYLKLVVTDAAAKRIGDVTAHNIGKVITVVLDGFTVFHSTISGPFSKEFKLSADYPFNEVRVIQALLDHGALPGPVGLISTSGLFDEAKSQ
jgi:hypothetical protein